MNRGEIETHVGLVGEQRCWNPRRGKQSDTVNTWITERILTYWCAPKFWSKTKDWSIQNSVLNYCNNDSHGWPRSLIFPVWQLCRKNIHSSTTTSPKIMAVLLCHPEILAYLLSLSKHSKSVLSSHKLLHCFRWPSTHPDTVSRFIVKKWGDVPHQENMKTLNRA